VIPGTETAPKHTMADGTTAASLMPSIPLVSQVRQRAPADPPLVNVPDGRPDPPPTLGGLPISLQFQSIWQYFAGDSGTNTSTTTPVPNPPAAEDGRTVMATPRGDSDLPLANLITPRLAQCPPKFK